jgi:MSHA biogenesis protein MshQ
MTITVPGLTATGNDRIEFCEPSASDNSLGSWIDNVRLQTFFPDHYEVSVPSSNVACQASTVKVTACADSSRPCTNALATPSTPTANLATSAGTLESGALTLSNGGIATTTLSYPTAADGGTATLTLSGESVPGANARTCCIGSTCSTANTCTATFKTAGFIFANTATGASATLPTQTAGTTSGTTYLRAVKTSTTTQACESALSGAQSVNWAVQCNNPTTCYANNLMSINGGTTTTVQGNPNNGVSGYTSVPMTFDASGSAPFTFNYSDVGQVTLWATKTVNSATLSGSTNAFVVKPGGFTVTSGSIKQTASPQLTNTGAADAAGNKFVKAGEAFTATVSAVTSGGTATPNFGRETVPEGVTLTVNLVAPSGGVAPALSNGAIAGASFGGAGSATVTTLAWSETGIITLTPSLTDGDYLGAGNVTGTTTGNIGRFYPDHFAVTQGATTPACGNVFSYFGQDGFATAFTLAAQNVGNTTTQNYTGSFAKLGLSTWSNFGFAAPGLPTGSALMASATPPTGTWGPGTASVTARHQVRRPTTLTGLATNTTVSVLAVPVDSDNVTMMAAQVAASTPLRYGRLRLQNAYGSELLALPVTATTEYRDASGFYVKNTDDSCTTVPVPTAGSGLTFGTGNLSAGETTASINGISSGLGTWAAGNGGLVLSRPGSGNNGFVDITLSVPDWLKFPWLGGSPVNPTAKAVFGIYKSPLIYRRENY